jgi:hypothetical membrane protein
MFDRRLLLKSFLTAAVAAFFFTIHKHLITGFETSFAIGLCFVLLLGIWSKRVRKHRAFSGAFYCYCFASICAVEWVERGPGDLLTWISGICFIIILILLVVILRLGAEPDEDDAD